jgi:hypothetical protein
MSVPVPGRWCAWLWQRSLSQMNLARHRTVHAGPASPENHGNMDHSRGKERTLPSWSLGPITRAFNRLLTLFRRRANPRPHSSARPTSDSSTPIARMDRKAKPTALACSSQREGRKTWRKTMRMTQGQPHSCRPPKTYRRQLKTSTGGTRAFDTFS